MGIVQTPESGGKGVRIAHWRGRGSHHVRGKNGFSDVGEQGEISSRGE